MDEDSALISDNNDKHRTVYLNSIENKKFCSNYISTTKYSIWTFIPKFLIEQLSRISNVFFLCLSLLQQIPGVSPVGRFATIIPLLFIMCTSAAKEIIEDIRRMRSDLKVNESIVKRLKWTWQSIMWSEVVVGDIVYINKNESFPADVVLLSTSEKEGICYIETSSLDGETNYKIRQALSHTCKDTHVEALRRLKGKITCDLPNEKIYKFSGVFMDSLQLKHPINVDNVVLRGSFLKSTEFAIGAVIYTGKESKIMMNSVPAPIKSSKMDRTANFFMACLIVVLLSLTVIFSVTNEILTKYTIVHHWYLDSTLHTSTRFLWVFMTFLISFHYIIPISLSVTVELVKFFAAFIINYDKNMYDPAKDMYASTKTSSIIEDLGQVNYIFTDKTGTLTQNKMQLKLLSIDGTIYGDKQDYWLDAKPHIDDPKVKRFMECLVLCNTVVKNVMHASSDDCSDVQIFGLKETDIQSSSPDETALVIGAHNCGFTFISRERTSLTFARNGEVETWEVLEILDFSSDRKRMSVIVKSPHSGYYLFCKGADEVLFELMNVKGQTCEMETTAHLEGFAKEGYRTLCIAYKEISEAEYSNWKEILHEAEISFTDKAKKLDDAYKRIEKNLILLGATAIEDALQSEVKETIGALTTANIKFWMLTGDKLETAINIGYSTLILQPSVEIITIDSENSEQSEEILSSIMQNRNIVPSIAYNKKRINPMQSKELSLVITGKAFGAIYQANLTGLFLDVSIHCQSIVCCRFSPIQKEQIVNLVKTGVDKVTTLAIGDGANDCSMIQTANVGIGISGNEGMQAANASDFTVSQFSHIRTLILYHGANMYRRLCNTIYFSFYKNVVFSQIAFFYCFVNLFSATVIFSSAAIALYNVIFTSLPPFAFGLLDQPVSFKAYMNIPRLYEASQKGYIFTYKKLAYWILNGYVHAGLIFVITYFTFNVGVIDESGFPLSINIYGVIVFTLIILTVSFKAALEFTSWTWATHIATWSGILLWFLFLAVYCRSFIALKIEPLMYNADVIMYSIPFFWLILPVSLIAVLPDFVFVVIKNTIFKPSHFAIAELERNSSLDWDNESHISKAKERLALNQTRKQKFFKKYLGFAFSIDENHGLRDRVFSTAASYDMKDEIFR